MSRPSLTAVALAAALAVALLPASAVVPSPAFAGGKEHGKGKPEQAGKPDKGHDAERGQDRGAAGGEAIIAAATAALIRSFFGGELPAGYVRPEPLPPGIRKNLARGKPLPPGIARKQLPEPLLARLPHHDGYRYYAVGRDVVLVAAATGLVADILRDAI
ncbi:hypothetical protein SAMN06265365_102182 [Tistlia consotensis]|uniref:Nickel/cobalt transporter regulator n=1 Tax=Tistlia consotensis USBA 355 TaxID=560819 RepID=A0A1Y6BFF2_9PROT|nr:anti-virulence regulator CigR family protein [Tistlia consotensis]SMF08403.1 hypothetical protein SAMN05428998_104134 [Tistlia consotensis USBA 355]SNR35398.1 hypothetical protein SAMN06265365_102182 [Tistlia consotensis]